MNLDEIFKEIDVETIFDRRFKEIGFTGMTRDEFFASIEKANAKYPAKYIAQLKKISEGWEKGYICHINNFTIIAWTSWMPSKKRFKKKDRLWVLILDPRNPDAFFAIPMNRVGDFIDRLVRTARIYKEKTMYWPLCTECEKMLFWEELFTYSEDESEIANQQFPLRYILCRNKKCSKCDQKVGLVTDILLPDEKDNDFFAAPFKRYAQERTRNIAKGIFRLSRRLWSWFKKYGIVVHRRKPYDDLVQEMIAKQNNFPDYDDLRNENFPGIYTDN